MTIATIFTTIKKGGEVFRVPLTRDFYLETLKKSPFYNRITSLANKIEALLREQKSAHRFDRNRFFEAAGVCVYAHRRAVREVSGLPYADHPIMAAERAVVELKIVDEDELVAYLLHDVVEESEINLRFIKHKFGKEVAGLVDGVTKITQWEKDKLINEENIDKFVNALRADIRVLRIKMVDRWVNLEDAELRSEESRRRNCQEALDFYAPLGVLAGFMRATRHLTDVALQKINPQRFREIEEIISQTLKKEKALLDKIGAKIKRRENVAVSVKPRTAYEVDQIATMRGTDPHHLSDIVMMQVTVASEKDCYAMVEAIHSLGIPQDHYWHDYIQDKKINGYRSIHTAILVGDTLIRFQIRTQAMQKQAEEGVLYEAHTPSGKFKQPDLPWLNTDWIKIILSVDDRRAKIILTKSLSQAWLATVIVMDAPGWSRVYRDVLVPRGVTPLELAFITQPELGLRLVGAIHKDMPKPIDKPIREAVGFIKLQTQKEERYLDFGKLLTNPLARLRFFDYFKSKTEFQKRQYICRILETELKQVFLNLQDIITTMPEEYDRLYSLMVTGKISIEAGVKILADKIKASKSGAITLERVQLEGEAERLSTELQAVRNILPLDRYGFIGERRLDLSFSVRSPAQSSQLANFIAQIEDNKGIKLVRDQRLTPPIIDDHVLNPYTLYFSNDLAVRMAEALWKQNGYIVDLNLDPLVTRKFLEGMSYLVKDHIATAGVLFLGGDPKQLKPFKATLEGMVTRVPSGVEAPLMVVFERTGPASRILTPMMEEGFDLPPLNIIDIRHSSDFILKAIAQRIGVVLE